MGLFNSLKSIKRDSLIRNSFLLPILLVVALSCAHVVSWYDIGNPMAWAIYLSAAVEIFALASISAASINIGRVSVWVLFCLVTSIQIIGNIFFAFNDIDENSKLFLSWVDLVKPFFDDWAPLDHKRLLAIIQGGTIPMLSLIALNFYIKFNDKKKQLETPLADVQEEVIKEEVKIEPEKINTPDDDDIAPYASR